MARICRPSRERDDQRMREIREVVALSRRLLAVNPRSYTFLGRKTQEPFPKEKYVEVELVDPFFILDQSMMGPSMV